MKGRIRDIKIFYLLVQSLNGHNGQRWAGSKPGARNFVSHVGAGFLRGHTGQAHQQGAGLEVPWASKESLYGMLALQAEN